MTEPDLTFGFPSPSISFCQDVDTHTQDRMSRMLSFFLCFILLVPCAGKRSSLLGPPNSHGSGETPQFFFFLSSAFSRGEFKDVEIDGYTVRNLEKDFLAARTVQIHA